MAKEIQTIRQKTPGKRVTDLMENIEKTGKIRISRAIIVEGRDDVDAVSKAADALIIPTHGFGIRETTWEIMEKAYREIGVIILTDPDHAGEDIRRRLTERVLQGTPGYRESRRHRDRKCQPGGHQGRS